MANSPDLLEFVFNTARRPVDCATSTDHSDAASDATGLCINAGAIVPNDLVARK